jgi:hypothetical protein
MRYKKLKLDENLWDTEETGRKILSKLSFDSKQTRTTAGFNKPVWCYHYTMGKNYSYSCGGTNISSI